MNYNLKKGINIAENYTLLPMSINHANPSADELYYECTPCDYTAPASIPIGLCPNCGESLQEKTILTR